MRNILVRGATLAVGLTVGLAGPAHAACPTFPLMLTATGAGAGDALGYAVANVGDVNGDGYADVLVGAPSNDAGGAEAGRAYLYFGGPLSDTTPDLVLTGEAADDAFGQAVAGMGDMNDDGFGDMIVGAPYHDANGSGSGRAYVFYGGSSPDTIPDVILDGAASNTFLGYSVAGAGDVNDDGFADVIVGAYAGGGSSQGRAYVFHGGLFPNSVPDLTLTGATNGDQFGASVGGAGDVNWDGFDDVIVGARLNDAAGADAGRAYVYFGGDPTDAIADLTLTGQASGDVFGTSVSGAGDMNLDGYDDVVVGAPYNDINGDFSGRAYVYFGGLTPNSTPDLFLNLAAPGDLFGISVARAGDVNGDLYPDVIVGAYTNDYNGLNAGRAYVYLGSATPDAVPDLYYHGDASGDQFGFSVSGGGDVNGDGFADLVMGATGNDVGGLQAGRAYVYGLRIPEVVINGNADASYGAPIAVQSIGTLFGNATSGTPGFANGSELDAIYARLTPRALCLLLAGNLQSDYKKLDLYFDTQPGEGQNKLRGDNPAVDGDGLNRMGDDGSGNGMRFDQDFSPDYYLTVTGGDTGGGHYEMFANWAELLTHGGGTARFLGRTDALSSGLLATGSNPHDIRLTINNSNTAGVTSGSGPSSGAGVTTGVEIWIPMPAFGCPPGCIRMAAVVNGSLYDFVSNQVIGSLPAETSNLGDPRFVDFSAIPGSQYITICREDLVGVSPPPSPLRTFVAAASPNPFFSSTELRFTLREEAPVSIEVYDVAGQRVSRLLDRTIAAGSHTVRWSGRDAAGHPLAPGVYYLRMESRGVVATRKVVKLQ